MKIPKSWERQPDQSQWPEFHFYLTPVSKAWRERLERDRKEAGSPSNIFMTRNRKRFGYENGGWYRERRVRNSDYVKPPFLVLLYGLKTADNGLARCWFPPDLAMSVMRPALNKVARNFGSSLYGGEDNRAYVEGMDLQIWNSKKVKLPRFRWNGQQLVPVKTPDEVRGGGMSDEKAVYVFSYGIHRGTLTSRDSGQPEEHPTRQACVDSWKAHKRWFSGMGYVIWFARIKHPDGHEERLDGDCNYV